MSESKMNKNLAFAVVSSACWSGFQHGYNTGVLNAPQKIMSEWLQHDVLTGTNTSISSSEDPKVTTVWAVAVSIYCFGGMLGGVLTGLIADRFGRKGGLLVNLIPVLVGVVLQAFAKSANSAELLIIGRFLIGINSGLNAGLVPLYVTEISPVALRGSTGTVYQLMITITILLSQILGLNTVLGTPDKWPVLISIPILPAIIQIATLPLCPETPKYLMMHRGEPEKAEAALTWLRGKEPGVIRPELEKLHQEAESNKIQKKATVAELFRNRSLRQPLTIGLMVMLAQQLSGINAVIFYSTEIFKNAKLDPSQAQYATLIMGLMNVIVTVVSLFLVERMGRRTLLIIGFGGLFIWTTLLCVASVYTHHQWVSYICIVLVVVYVMTFAIGPGSIPWFLVTELFSQTYRSVASSLAVCVNWTANFFVGLTFLPITLVLGSYTFIIFAVFLLIFFIFIYLKVPETKNKSIEEITAMFRQRI